MIHDISKLHAVTIWMTVDFITYSFLVEFRDLKMLFKHEKHESPGSFIRKIITETRLLASVNNYSGFRLKFLYNEECIYYLSHDEVLFEDHACNGKVVPRELKIEIDKYDSLTSHEKKIFWLLGEGLRQEKVCEELNIKLDCLKYHRSKLYNKMNFDTQVDLLVWLAKYKYILHAQ